MPKDDKWSNEVKGETVTPTVKPTQPLPPVTAPGAGGNIACIVTNKNLRALRVIYDAAGKAVTLHPGQTKEVTLPPGMAEKFSRAGSDLEVCR
jgi:hypothetical protein